MANMRVHELAKELNISSKEIIDTLNNDNKTYKTMSGLSENEVSVINKKYKNARPGSQQTAKTQENQELRKTSIDENKKIEKSQDNQEEKKSHISQVYFPQNSSKGGIHEGNQSGQRNDYRGNRNNLQNGRTNMQDNNTEENKKPRNNVNGEEGQNRTGYQNNRNSNYQGNRNSNYQGNRDRNGYQGNRDNNASQGSNGEQTNRSNNGYQGNRDGNGYQGNRSSNGYQGNRDGNGYQGNRSNNGYQGNRDGNGYQGNRSNNGYQGNRDNNGTQGNRSNNGYQGNRDGNGYQGNRSNNGYQGNRDGNGYQGNRSNNGYQGNRDGNGYQGNRSNNGYQGNRDNNGTQGNRDGNGYQGNRSNNGYQGNRDRNGYQGNGYQGNRDNNGQGGSGYQGNRDGNGYQGNRSNNGYQGNRSGTGFRPNNGTRNDNGQGNRNSNGQWNRNNSGQGGFRSNDGRDNRPGFQNRRNDKKETSSTDEKFVFETKPDARRPEARKDPKKNDRKKDTEARENLKFVNGQYNKKPVKPVEKVETIKQLVLPDVLTIKELADKMKIQPSALVKKLFLQGKVVTINQEIDYDVAEEIALEYNCICEHEVKIDVIAEMLKEEDEDQGDMVPRPPVVCVMGHVDHGKTSLLDAIRETHVTAKESGGITQKIGAYTVSINNQSITFLDTPGHEAFTAMRMRGAQATDIAILVVAADDGVMPQTIEAINHAKAAGVEIIVAVNKIDKPNANIEKVKQELTEYELVSEDWGGSTIFVPVSAHTKEGIDDLLEMILLTAEVHELKSNPNRKARGIVIEAELDKGRGPVASILVQKGTLKVGDSIAAGSCYGKIRAMIDDKGERVKEAGPSTPVEILGLNDVPNAGEIIIAMDSEKESRAFAETFISEGRKKMLDDTKHKVSLDALFEQIKAGNVKELGLIIKADVQGSVEAVKQSLLKLSNEEVVVKVIHGGVGNINESDVVLASASNAIIIGFNVKPDNQARLVADRENVDLRLYSVIYNAIEDVEAALKGMLEPIYAEQVIGHAIIRQIFKASGIGNIAGSFVTDGKITRNATVRISRAGEKTYEGPIASLKRFKDEVKEVKSGFECGLVFEKFNDLQEDDVVEAYEMVEVPR